MAAVIEPEVAGAVRLEADATYGVRLKADTTYTVRLKADTTYADTTYEEATCGEAGFSLIETLIALGVLTTGLLTATAVLSSGLLVVATAPGDLTATQKAVEAIESVVSARDTRTLAWAEVRNVLGASGADGGVFVDGPQPIRIAGPDGIVDTADDAGIETIILPGRDQNLGTGDDETVRLDAFRREIAIRDVSPNLRSVTVTVTYRAGSTVRSYTLTTYLSNYS